MILGDHAGSCGRAQAIIPAAISSASFASLSLHVLHMEDQLSCCSEGHEPMDGISDPLRGAHWVGLQLARVQAPDCLRQRLWSGADQVPQAIQVHRQLLLSKQTIRQHQCSEWTW